MRAAASRVNVTVSEANTATTGQHFRLPAVDRAMSLFELLSTSENGLTLSELSRKLNMPKSTTHYLIYTLATRGYVRQTTRRHYSLGLYFAKLANASTAELDLRKLATPHLRKIAAKLNLTAALTALSGSESVVIGIAPSIQTGGGGAWIGRHIDLHCTAQGKALVCTLSEEKLNKIFAGREFAPFTPKTILSLSAFKTHLAEVRAKGYSVCDEEYYQGVRAVAAPVFDSLNEVVAAVSVRGSAKQIPSSRIFELGREMICTSRDITMEISNY